MKTLSQTFERFFKGYSNYPKFKSGKITKQSYRTVQSHHTIRLNTNQRYIKLPKLGWVKCKLSVRHLENERIKSVTITYLPSGLYTISVLVENESQVLVKTGNSVGIDFGLTHLAITSDGDKHESQRLHLKYKKQLHYWEKRMARRKLQAKAKGIDLRDAKNYQVAKRQVARIHEKITHTRRDYTHKITTEWVEQYDFIAIEDLRTANMMKNHKLARSIAAQSWRNVREMLVYKCERYGKQLVLVNPYKTSQLCSSCLYDSGKKSLDIRQWICPKCHITHDRDINAAKNILRKGLEQAIVN